MSIGKKLANILILLSSFCLLILFSLLIYHFGSEFYLYQKFSEGLSGYSAIEIVNETNKTYKVNLINMQDGEMFKALSVAAMDQLKILTSSKEHNYQLIFTDDEQQKKDTQLYVSSLPAHRYRVRLTNEGEIEIETIKNDYETLEGYHRQILKMQ
ncbi:hypothetical protein K8I31_20640 [bacterium]|nr:hypothetical protein [bacterium]